MNCLICGSNEKKILTKLCSNMDIMGPFFRKRSSNIVVCRNCGFIYTDIDVEQSAFTEYYKSDYSKSLSYYEVFGQEQTDIYYNDIYKRIEPYLNKDSKILEIGGGIGELSLFIKNKGYKNITVLEPSKRCIDMCKEKGLNTICSDGFDGGTDTEKKYDFIIINHTLEHILAFDKIMKFCWQKLEDAGHMYIEVPDASKYAETQFVPYWFFTYEHVFHMTLQSMDNLAASFMFKIIRKESYLKCNSYNVMYGIFEKDDKKHEIVKDEVGADNVQRYIEQCEERLKPVISTFEKSREKIILWGIGTSTAQLLNGNFDNCNVTKLVDSNPYRQKVEYTIGERQMQIEDPKTISEDDGVIMILPLMYDSSIRKQIFSMGLKNQVKSLIENYK